jgi:hypothetical protein
MLPNGLCSSHGVHRQRESIGYCWLSSTGTPPIALDYSGPSVQAPGATSMQAPAATSVEAQLLLRVKGLMTGSSGSSGSAPDWAIWDIESASRPLINFGDYDNNNLDGHNFQWDVCSA